MKLNRELAVAANRNGICKDWHIKLQKTEDKGELVKMYLEGIDFCLSNDYPSNAFIREHFIGFCEAYGVFLDSEIKTENFRKVVALGECKGVASYTGFEAGEVFVKHNSKLTIVAGSNAFVMVDIFDDCEVVVEAADDAKVCVNHYGGSITTSTEGNAIIKVIRKHSKTY